MNAVVRGLHQHQSRILRAQGISLVQRGQTALDRVSLTAWPGELTTLIGSHDSGKALLLQVLGGGVAPSSGEVWLGAHSLAALPAEVLRRELFCFPAHSRAAASLTAADLAQPRHMSFWARFVRGPVRAEPAERTLQALAAVGLGGQAEASVAELDAYERIAARLAGAILANAGVILLEVPCGELNLVQMYRLQRLLRQLAAQGRTVVQVLNELSSALDFADRLVLMGKGRVLAIGSADDILASGRLTQAYGVPLEAQRHVMGWSLRPVLG